MDSENNGRQNRQIRPVRPDNKCAEERRLLQNMSKGGDLQSLVQELQSFINKNGGQNNYTPCTNQLVTTSSTGNRDCTDDCRCGDMNNDGTINILDVVTLATCVLDGNCWDVLSNNGLPSCIGDMNQDGGYNILDIVTLINCILGEHNPCGSVCNACGCPTPSHCNGDGDENDDDGDDDDGGDDSEVQGEPPLTRGDTDSQGRDFEHCYGGSNSCACLNVNAINYRYNCFQPDGSCPDLSQCLGDDGLFYPEQCGCYQIQTPFCFCIDPEGGQSSDLNNDGYPSPEEGVCLESPPSPPGCFDVDQNAPGNNGEGCCFFQVPGCIDPNACNYNEDANFQPAGYECEYCYQNDCNNYPYHLYDCDGNCLSGDSDSDGVCDAIDNCIGMLDNCGFCYQDEFPFTMWNFQCSGCMDPAADNFGRRCDGEECVSCLQHDNEICVEYQFGVCTQWPQIEEQGDGCCQYLGCTNQNACNYNPGANVDDGSCVMGINLMCYYDSNDNGYWDEVVYFVPSDGYCSCEDVGSRYSSLEGYGEEIAGCGDTNACNYCPPEICNTIDNSLCWYPEENFDCSGNCVHPNGIDCQGVCGGESQFDECNVCNGDGTSCCYCTDGTIPGCLCGPSNLDNPNNVCYSPPDGSWNEGCEHYMGGGNYNPESSCYSLVRSLADTNFYRDVFPSCESFSSEEAQGYFFDYECWGVWTYDPEEQYHEVCKSKTAEMMCAVHPLCEANSNPLGGFNCTTNIRLREAFSQYGYPESRYANIFSNNNDIQSHWHQAVVTHNLWSSDYFETQFANYGDYHRAGVGDWVGYSSTMSLGYFEQEGFDHFSLFPPITYWDHPNHSETWMRPSSYLVWEGTADSSINDSNYGSRCQAAYESMVDELDEMASWFDGSYEIDESRSGCIKVTSDRGSTSGDTCSPDHPATYDGCNSYPGRHCLGEAGAGWSGSDTGCDNPNESNYIEPWPFPESQRYGGIRLNLFDFVTRTNDPTLNSISFGFPQHCLDVWESWGTGPKTVYPGCEGEQCNQYMCSYYHTQANDFSDDIVGILWGGRPGGMFLCTPMIGLPCLPDGSTLTEEDLQIGQNGWGNCDECAYWAWNNLTEEQYSQIGVSYPECEDINYESDICQILDSNCAKTMCEAAGFDVSDMEESGHPYYVETGMFDGMYPFICGEAETFDNSPTCHDPAACNYDEEGILSGGIPCFNCCEYPPDDDIQWDMYQHFKGCNSCGDNAYEQADSHGDYPCEWEENGWLDWGSLANYTYTTYQYWCDTPQCPANLTDDFGNVETRLGCAGECGTSEIYISEPQYYLNESCTTVIYATNCTMTMFHTTQTVKYSCNPSSVNNGNYCTNDSAKHLHGTYNACCT